MADFLDSATESTLHAAGVPADEPVGRTFTAVWALGGLLLGALLGGAVGGGAGVIVVATWLTSDADVEAVRAGSFILVDSSGAERGKFWLGPSGEPALTLGGASGRITLATTPDTGPMIGLFSGDGTVQTVLSGSPILGAGLALHDSSGAERLAVHVKQNGDPALTLRDGSDAARAAVMVTSSGPALLLQSASGRTKAVRP
jgi:hypothetical protein